MSLTDTPSRSFFGRKTEQKPAEEEKKAEPEQAEEAKDAKAAEGEESESAAAAGDDKKAEKDDSSSSSSSDDSSADEKGDEEGLSAKDVKRIKALFAEQESEIKAYEKQVKQLEEAKEKLEAESKRKDNETRLARIEYTKQVKENELTVQRYRKMIEDEKEFAIDIMMIIDSTEEDK